MDKDNKEPVKEEPGAERESKDTHGMIKKMIEDDIEAGKCERFFRISDYDPELKKQKEEFMKRLLSQN